MLLRGGWWVAATGIQQERTSRGTPNFSHMRVDGGNRHPVNNHPKPQHQDKAKIWEMLWIHAVLLNPPQRSHTIYTGFRRNLHSHEKGHKKAVWKSRPAHHLLLVVTLSLCFDSAQMCIHHMEQ